VDVEGCLLPEDRRYDLETYVWLLLEDSGDSAKVGLLAPLTAFAGRISSVTYRPIEGRLERGRSLGLIESVRYTGAVRMPVNGTVLERNPRLLQRPKLLNDDPYGEGWFARIGIEVPDRVPSELEDAAAIRDRLAREIQSKRIRCYPAYPDAELYEIGAECQAILARLDEEIDRRAPNEVVLLVTDDATSPIEMVRWSDRTGHSVLHHRAEGTLHHFLVRREPHPVPRRRRPTPEPV
jgi:glycine cleavage system H protein